MIRQNHNKIECYMSDVVSALRESGFLRERSYDQMM